MKIKINKKLKELSSMSGVSAVGFPTKHKDLDEMYSSSAINMMGAGLKQIDPTPEQEQERYNMNYINKNLQNYKPSKFLESKKLKIKIRISKKLVEGGASKSYCKSTPCKKMGFTQKASCKSQGIKDCYRGKKKD